MTIDDRCCCSSFVAALAGVTDYQVAPSKCSAGGGSANHKEPRDNSELCHSLLLWIITMIIELVVRSTTISPLVNTVPSGH